MRRNYIPSIFQNMEQRTIRAMIDDAGGANPVAEAAVAAGYELTVDAVYKWRHNGIPDRYWSIVMPMAGATADELFRANELLRAEKAA